MSRSVDNDEECEEVGKVKPDGGCGSDANTTLIRHYFSSVRGVYPPRISLYEYSRPIDPPLSVRIISASLQLKVGTLIFMLGSILFGSMINDAKISLWTCIISSPLSHFWGMRCGNSLSNSWSLGS